MDCDGQPWGHRTPLSHGDADTLRQGVCGGGYWPPVRCYLEQRRKLYDPAGRKTWTADRQLMGHATLPATRRQLLGPMDAKGAVVAAGKRVTNDVLNPVAEAL